MDVPDELRSVDLGLLDEGDEVQVVENRGVYRLVLCPDGRQGWVHKMVLGDVVEDDDAYTPRRPTAPRPAGSSGDEATDELEGVDEDVLSAFLSVRDRTA
jgi:hypothetical protein